MAHTDEITTTGQIVDRLFAALQAHDVDAVVRGCSEDVVLTAPGDVEIRGRTAYAEFVRGWLAAFPDLSWEVTNKVVSGDAAIIESTARGTHTGTLHTPDGDVAPTGRTFTNRLCEIDEVRNGQVARTRLYWDTLPLTRQLGLQPGPMEA
jgi:steroid delta-isomerase-like uncharacterized protein